ncbi:DUF2798 domain-containing protein [Oceanirhabdus seepicola]|uniref:DUF2798 domain-containing protein n=1 Tax=Oceanirhabdus seepicola TaxID=2828781 RepID=A0A9J6NXU2_9CLOT|nr:DUF2798 domain-containing protein [Oceanirhabdus seepicola]MCM1988713.1 DUF2798 domain-containing protein [Oceanirhabdus seepicola]
MRINRKYEGILFAFLMAAGMSCLISLVMTLINVGISSALFGIWIKAWGIGFIVSLPVSIFYPPVIRKVIKKLTI